jgi:hypothetical protein
MSSDPLPLTAPPAAAQPAIGRGLTLLLAVLGGVAVGNLYWAQPLLHTIADDLHVSTGTVGSLVTATQLGYAVGILLLVPAQPPPADPRAADQLRRRPARLRRRTALRHPAQRDVAGPMTTSCRGLDSTQLSGIPVRSANAQRKGVLRRPGDEPRAEHSRGMPEDASGHPDVQFTAAVRSACR